MTWLLSFGLAACALAFLNHPAIDVDGYAFPKELVLGVTAGLAGALALWRARGRRPGAEDLCLLLLLALGVLSAALIPANPWMAWRAVSLTLAGATLYWAARQGGQGVLPWAAGIAVFVALLVLLESHGLLEALSLPQRAPGATLGNRNYAAHFLVLALPLLGALTLASERPRQRLVLAAGLALCAASIVLTRSRAAWLAAMLLVVLLPAAALAIPATVRRGRLARGGAIILVALVLGVGLGALVPNQLALKGSAGSTLGRLLESESGSGRGRLLQYQNTLEIVKTHPLLGAGPGNWFTAYPAHARPGDPTFKPDQVWQTPAFATSDWLGLASERGLPAVLAYLGFLLVVAGRAVRRLRRASGVGEATRALAQLGLVAALAVMGALDVVIQLPLPTCFCFAVLGALEPAPGPGAAWSRPLRQGAAALCLVVFGLVTAMNVRQVAALWLVSEAPLMGEQVDDPEVGVRWDRAASLALGQSRIAVLGALDAAARHDCDRARRLARLALHHDPSSVLAGRLEATCSPAPPPVAPQAAGERK